MKTTKKYQSLRILLADDSFRNDCNYFVILKHIQTRVV